MVVCPLERILQSLKNNVCQEYAKECAQGVNRRNLIGNIIRSNSSHAE